jgi:hypothetical protein
LATQKNTKEEAVIEETLWLGRGFIQGHKVSIVFSSSLPRCVCGENSMTAKTWRRNTILSKCDYARWR